MHMLFMLVSTMAGAAAVTASADATSRSEARADSKQPVQVRVQVQVQADGTGKVVVNEAGPADRPAPQVDRPGPEGADTPKVILPKVEKQAEQARIAAEQHAEAVRNAIQRLTEQMQKGTGQQPPAAPGSFGMQGSITIIGPDGATHTQTFEKFGNGDQALPDVRQLVEQALKAAGAKLPEDVRDKLDQALAQPGRVEAPADARPALDATDISSKLDRILDRLEKLEADVQTLKATRAAAE